MDRERDDIPKQVPATPVVLQRIGIVREAIPVTIVDPFQAGALVQLFASVEAHLSIDAQRRGIHVSRLGDVLARLSARTFDSLEHYAQTLCERFCDEQGSEDADVRVTAVLSYLEDVEGVKQKQSIEHLSLGASARRHDDRTQTTASVGFRHITACPCVQQTFKHSAGGGRSGLFGELAAREMPLLTHSQRCETVVTFGGDGESIALDALLDAIDGVVVRSQNTLPREAELAAVHRAHAKPQFLEDALRDLLRALYELLRHRRPDGTITIEATSMESIHDFDISGSIHYSVAEIARLLG
jgi:GTP cyclohydrolase FolE2